MKLCIVGQGTGGNASIWFDYFNSKNKKTDRVKITFICRTIRTLEANFKIIAPYGNGKTPSFIYKLYAPFIARIGLQLIIKSIKALNKFDALLLQGNYTPSQNLMIMKELNCHTIVNIYGSDFYRKYLLNEFSPKEKENFVKVLENADDIVLNWQTTYSDFVNEFPEYSKKCSMKSWGVSESWITSPILPKKDLEKELTKFQWPKAEKVFLSARALYDYNNIDIIVEAFCRTYEKNKNYKLFIVNGYGNHKTVIEKVNSIIDKYDAHDRVITKIGKWISDEELQYLYHRADYNFCFGSTDQLTVSIVYSFLSKTINILSPIQNYRELVSCGYKSPLLSSELSLSSLESLLNTLPAAEILESNIEDDKVAALEEFNMDSTFNHYISLVK
jgi:glycosyltransferase involved in cell wall biosynthesis